MTSTPTIKVVDAYTPPSFRKEECIRFTSAAPFTPTYVTSNLSLSSDPAMMYNARVKGRQILLENPVRESRAKKELDRKRTAHQAARERKKQGIIGKKEAREKGIWKFDEKQAKYALFLPLHSLWRGYMSELLNLASEGAPSAVPNASTMHPKLLKADYHGSIMTVSQSKNPCLVGVSGIVIHETENAFKVVTTDDEVKLLPKQNSIFKFAVPLCSTLPASHAANTPLPIELPSQSATKGAPGSISTVLDGAHIEFELYGNQFRFRASERAGRKFKHKETIEL